MILSCCKALYKLATETGITKSYGSGDSLTLALRGIDLNVEKGEFCVLLGPSGSGKSTLLNVIGGIDAATSGEIVIGDHRLKEMNDRSRIPMVLALKLE